MGVEGGVHPHARALKKMSLRLAEDQVEYLDEVAQMLGSTFNHALRYCLDQIMRGTGVAPVIPVRRPTAKVPVVREARPKKKKEAKKAKSSKTPKRRVILRRKG